MKTKNELYDKLIEFFQQSETWDKEAIIDGFCDEVLKDNKWTWENGNVYSPDEVSLVWGDELIFPLTLEDYSKEFFEKVIDGVVNVIESFKDRNEKKERWKWHLKNALGN